MPLRTEAFVPTSVPPFGNQLQRSSVSACGARPLGAPENHQVVEQTASRQKSWSDEYFGSPKTQRLCACVGQLLVGGHLLMGDLIETQAYCGLNAPRRPQKVRPARGPTGAPSHAVAREAPQEQIGGLGRTTNSGLGSQLACRPIASKGYRAACALNEPTMRRLGRQKRGLLAIICQSAPVRRRADAVLFGRISLSQQVFKAATRQVSLTGHP